jgi:hypothetical protein
MRFLVYAILAVIAYYGFFKTDAPKPGKPWHSYAKNAERNRIEWLHLISFESWNECSFAVEKALKGSTYYREPAGCLYRGYQNPYVLWVVNSIIAPNAWMCIAENKERDKYNDPQWDIVVAGSDASETSTYKCFLKS